MLNSVIVANDSVIKVKSKVWNYCVQYLKHSHLESIQSLSHDQPFSPYVYSA